MKRVRGEGGKFNSNDGKRSDSADLSDGYEVDQKPNITMVASSSHPHHHHHHGYQMTTAGNLTHISL